MDYDPRILIPNHMTYANVFQQTDEIHHRTITIEQIFTTTSVFLYCILILLRPELILVGSIDGMNTAAYLERHGWLGSGHSLHPAGHGITKPVTVSRKSNVLGLGKKANDIYMDRWWARLSETTLDGLRIGIDKDIAHQETVPEEDIVTPLKQSAQDSGRWARAGTLYGGFVKGEGLDGTLKKKILEPRTADQRINLRNQEGRSDKLEQEPKLSRKRNKLQPKTVDASTALKLKLRESTAIQASKDHISLQQRDLLKKTRSDVNRRGESKLNFSDPRMGVDEAKSGSGAQLRRNRRKSQKRHSKCLQSVTVQL